MEPDAEDGQKNPRHKGDDAHHDVFSGITAQKQGAAAAGNDRDARRTDPAEQSTDACEQAKRYYAQQVDHALSFLGSALLDPLQTGLSASGHERSSPFRSKDRVFEMLSTTKSHMEGKTFTRKWKKVKKVPFLTEKDTF